MNEEALGAETKEPERSLLGPLGSCLAVTILLAALVGGGVFFRQKDPRPVLIREGERLTLSWEGGPSLPLLLGPGCLGPALAEGDEPALTYQGRGKPFVMPLGSEGERYFLGALRTDAGEAAGKAILLLPNGRCRLVPSESEVVLGVERWEGPFRGGVCTVWVYDHPSWLEGPDAEFLDASGFEPRPRARLPQGTTSDGSWALTELGREAGWLREFAYFKPKDRAVYLLSEAGKTEKADLERASQGKWSLGDPAPESRAH